METVKLLLMAYLKYISEAEFVNILQSFLKLLRMEDMTKEVSLTPWNSSL